MNILIGLVNQLQDFCTEGTDLRQFEPIVREIDTHSKVLLTALEFNPRAVPHVVLFEKPEDDRLKEVQEARIAAENTPEAAIPYVVNAYCRSIYEIVGKDLLAFATDFSAGLNLQFRISFSSFANSYSSFCQDTEKKRIQTRLQEMKNEGYVIGESNHMENVLTDCDVNRNLLRAYCLKTFGSEPWKIKTFKNSIMEMEMVVRYNKFSPIWKEPEEAIAPPLFLTADDVIRLSKAISDVKFALASYGMMNESGNGNILLSCLQGHIYEIESITGVHGDIWEEREKEVAGVRRKNHAIRAAEEEIQKAAVVELAPRMSDIMWKARENMDGLAREMGLYLDQFSLQEYNRIDLVLKTNRVLFNSPKVKLDGRMMEKSHEFYVYNTPKNLMKILETVQSVFPSAALETYEVQPYLDFLYIKRISIRSADPMDMMRILQMEIAGE